MYLKNNADFEKFRILIHFLKVINLAEYLAELIPPYFQYYYLLMLYHILKNN